MTRESPFYGDQGVHRTAFSGRSATIYPPLNTQGYRKVKRMRVCRVPPVRPYEDLPGALPPVEFRRRPVSTKEDKRRSNVGAFCRFEFDLADTGHRVGGGGAGEARKEKLKAKNLKLAEERNKRTAAAEEKSKGEKEKSKEDE